MKCQQCNKPATFHITELTDQQPQELHLCEDHAADYLSHAEPEEHDPGSVIAGQLAQHLKVGQTAEELSRLDQQACPVCGITFFEFRNHGRLGCPHDYECFADELQPLLVNIHGDTEHLGKRPANAKGNRNATDLIRLRREMKEAVDREEYELASQIRDKIKKLEE
jgi:protein arginine kinase activator